MCLVAFGLQASKRFPFVLASNRDEFFARPADALAWWPDGQRLGGRDLQGGGGWLLLRPNGHLALVTNVREPQQAAAVDAPSRGQLVHAVLGGDERLIKHPAMAGYNLLQIDLRKGSGRWRSNRPMLREQTLEPGRVLGLSNAALDTGWPKVQRLKAALQAALAADDIETPLWAALRDPAPALDAELPDTGVGLLRERQLSSAFMGIDGPDGVPAYGTRCSTLVLMDAGGEVTVAERRFAPGGALTGETRIAFRP